MVSLHKTVTTFQPSAVVIDPVTNLNSVGDEDQVHAMLTRLIDFLKGRQITAIFTSLTQGRSAVEQSEVKISSLVDTWLLLRMLESSHERNRVLYVLKSRGMPHSNQMREFQLSDQGIELVDVYLGPGQVLTGAARVQQEARDQVQALAEQQAFDRRQRELHQQLATAEVQIAEWQSKLTEIKDELKMTSAQARSRREAARREHTELAVVRHADAARRIRK